MFDVRGGRPVLVKTLDYLLDRAVACSNSTSAWRLARSRDTVATASFLPPRI